MAAVPRIDHEIRDMVSKPTHLGLKRYGSLPTDRVAHMPGESGEVPGEHRNMHGERWESFKSDISENGVQHGLMIWVDHTGKQTLAEGNHRRDAAVELGIPEVPVEVNYYGGSHEHDTLFHDRRGE